MAHGDCRRGPHRWALQGVHQSTSGDVIVGEGAHIDAKVSGRNVLIAGEVRGQVEASGKMELTLTGKLFGNLRASKMYIEEGAVFQGECKTFVESAPASKPGKTLLTRWTSRSNGAKPLLKRVG